MIFPFPSTFVSSKQKRKVYPVTTRFMTLSGIVLKARNNKLSIYTYTIISRHIRYIN